jgi:hypothetical protein
MISKKALEMLEGKEQELAVKVAYFLGKSYLEVINTPFQTIIEKLVEVIENERAN